MNMKTFRLIGRTIEFRAVSFTTILGNVKCVTGVSLDGKWKTTARIVDTIKLS